MDIRTGSISSEARARGDFSCCRKKAYHWLTRLRKSLTALPRLKLTCHSPDIKRNRPAPNLHFPAIRKWENGVSERNPLPPPPSTSTFAKASSAKILSLPGKQLGRCGDVASSLSRKTTSDRFIMYYSGSVGKTLALLHVSKIIFFGGLKAATESD